MRTWQTKRGSKHGAQGTLVSFGDMVIRDAFIKFGPKSFDLLLEAFQFPLGGMNVVFVLHSCHFDNFFVCFHVFKQKLLFISQPTIFFHTVHLLFFNIQSNDEHEN